MEELKLNHKTIELLEYDKIKEALKGYALSNMAKERIEKLEPLLEKSSIEIAMKETTEARSIVNISSSIPINSLAGVDNVRDKFSKGIILSPADLEMVAELLKEIKRLKNFMRDKNYVAPTISLYALSSYELDDVREEIEKAIVRGSVADRASSKLFKIRKDIAILEGKIKAKLENFLKDDRYKSYIQDSLISQKNSRYVIPIKSEHKKQVEGSIHDRSQSGSTVFIEPADVKKMQDKLENHIFEEEKEVYRILSALTALVCEREKEVNVNIEVMSNYDFIFAKGKYSKSMDGRSVSFNNENYIHLKGAKHPFIGKDAVPLDFEIGKNYKGLIITGPNTGGKTVTLKTVGLLTMMAQTGLHVPVEEGSEIAIFNKVLVDIGDGQSIQQSLSTFSSHIKNIIHILEDADSKTLVILDELGAGTDPGEGMGIAVAILEALYHKESTICATTHYSEIKEFAQNHEGFINGSMAFDINTLKPLYKLYIGKPGESNAFLIALRLGMDGGLIERAHEVTYKDKKDYSKYAVQYTVNTQEKLNVQKDSEKKEHKKVVADRGASKAKRKEAFQIGDCVFISFMNRTGIICEGENGKGEYGVMVMQKKIKINQKRLSLYIEKKELYPEDYDFDIVLKTKDYRKKDKLINKGQGKGISIEL